MRSNVVAGCSLAILSLALSARASDDGAACRFRSFSSTGSFPDSRRGTAGSGESEPRPSPEPVVAGAPKRFLTALGELALLEVGPWAFDRYVAKHDFAYISTHTARENFRRGFGYDNDDFHVNQSAHPYHGSLFFEAARSNGFSFWESGLFAAAGSAIWECCMENTQPSYNDLVNTTLGGMTRGEVSHRVSAMILDNTARGGERVAREISAAFVNPVGALNRLLRGETTRVFDNPHDRYPGIVAASVDVGYRRIVQGDERPDQVSLSLSLLYGDPFEGDLKRPFDSFSVGIDLNTPGTLVSRIEERGVLKGWELSEPASAVRHVFGFAQEYVYINNASQVFGAQVFSMGLLSRARPHPTVLVLTDVSLLGLPMAGIRTTDFLDPETGRNYDYDAGGGVRVAARAFWKGREVLGAGYVAVWGHTLNGNSKNNTLQFFRAVARLPIVGPLGAGAGYTWYARKTTYEGFFEARQTQAEWRAFVNVAIPLHGR